MTETEPADMMTGLIAFLAARYAEEWAVARDRELASGLHESRETRDVDAKREILALYGHMGGADLWHVVHILGTVYSNRPDYDPAWKPMA